MSSTSNVKESLHYKFKEKIQKKANEVFELKDLLEFLPENLPDACEPIIIWGGRELRIGMPLDPPLNNRVRQRFVEAGYEVDDFEVEDYGFMQSATAKLKDDKDELIAEFNLACFDHNEGSTCTFEIVGEIKETTTKKVYEVICTEGAEEKVFA